MVLKSTNSVVTSVVLTPPMKSAPKTSFVSKSAGPISVERASELDAPAMAQVGGATFTATFGHSVSKEDLEDFLSTTYSAEAIVTELADPSKTYLVAKSSDGVVAGIAQLHRGKTHSSVSGAAHEVAVMQKVYVNTSAHGQGIGTKLIAAIEQLAREEGIKKMWLTVWEENVKAQKLYEKLGYEKTGEIDFVTGTCVQTDYVLAKSL